jgi:hypothetical protein
MTMRSSFSAARWLALFVFFAGLVLVFVTKNVRLQLLFNIAASGLICFDSFVLAPRPKLSLLNASNDAKTKFRPSLLTWVAFVPLVASLLYMSHIRLSALLMMSAFFLLGVDQFMGSNSASKDN